MHDEAALLAFGSVGDAIALTDAGDAACAAAHDTHQGLTFSDIKVGAFLAFYWESLLIDPEATDIGALEAAMDELIRSRTLQLPWLYGRRVDDHYLSRFHELRDAVDPDETQALINDLPQGVFHVGEYVSGPFGLLRSSDSRWLLPGTGGPLLGCSDPGCNALHRVRLSRSYSPVRGC